MNKQIFTLFLIYILFCGANTLAQYSSRTKQSINEDWKFCGTHIEGGEAIELNDSTWTNITIPHTWNKLDAIDETKGYSRKVCWYRKTLFIPKENAKLIATCYLKVSTKLQIYMSMDNG
ncbi:hypothetical protein [Saccharicrinis fermentans]|uniref:Glycosyl hydrolase family 2 n=1 Tax=Saccharicrinis fermentans DSM 9555 = JCM 21142 TaxID=869213 RepID=W7Y5G0_9BACT|nr:hypothetical protein [Saccharicrinis fermentans]GAF03337.1 glycosyl hydrolase family 2 [Saccharicrinis fermentans DSM 9555 = JCM 21142]